MNASAGNGAAETGAAQTAASTERPAASVLIVDDDKWTTRAVAAALRD
ncbi:DNA-binding response regulator, partial [Burkholderia multivorans]